MLPLILLSAIIAASGPYCGMANARTLRAGGVVTGSGRAPPPPQEHSGELFGLLRITVFTHYGLCIWYDAPE